MSALRESKIGKHLPPGTKAATPRVPSTGWNRSTNNGLTFGDGPVTQPISSPLTGRRFAVADGICTATSGS